MNWIRQLKRSFGIPFLMLICLIYWTQGFRSFAWMAVSYHLKDDLKLSPSASQFLVTIAFFPWSVKPIYGILSDCVPIRGRKRLPYLVIASLLSLVPWILLGVAKFMRNSYVLLTIFLTFQNLGSAMADVVIDAMVAEATRQEREAYAGDLQSLSWLSMAIGGITGSIVGGLALSDLRIDIIFILFSAFPAIQLFACSLVEEKPSSSSKAVEETNNEVTDEREALDMLRGRQEEPEEKPNRRKNDCSQQLNTDVLEEQDSRDDEDWVKIQKKKSGEIIEETNEGIQDAISMNEEIDISKDKQLSLHEVEGMRRRRDLHVPEVDKEFSEVESKVVDHKYYKEKRWLLSVKSTFRTLIQAMRQPAILRPMLWFFLAQVAIPNISTVMFYYQTDFLRLDASLLGAARVVGWGGLMLGTFIYNHYLKHVQLRKLFLGAHIGLSLLTLIDVILVQRINISFGISDKAFVICTSALADAVNQFKLMPFLVLSGRLCPPGIEGTLFALFMSINNFGSTVSSFFGAVLASTLDISSERFDNLAVGIYVQAICTLLPICFLFLIPKKATGTSSQE
uniref:Major facilitator superfamily (MFS) profile domain-containing protein n=1 Tax=Araucaria cunninghamii TaxID=56994 RepID=A0A0D6R6R0_ARACU